MSQDTSWKKWLFYGTCACAVAGGGYLLYRNFAYAEDESDDEESAPKEQQVPPSTSAHAPATTPHSAQPSLPIRPTPKKTSSAQGSKLCSHCNEPMLSGLPKRCSRCKAAYYCSEDCQRKAWPSHKATCSTSASSAQPTNDSSTRTSDDGTEAVSTTAQEPDTRPVEEKVKSYLEQNISTKEDKLDALYETAVLTFLHGNYRQAIQHFTEAQEMAKSRGNKAAEGDVWRWLGHCYSKLGEVEQASDSFDAGLKFARGNDNAKLQIDCLNGKGVMLRNLNKPEEAIELFMQALAVTEAAQDLDSRASVLNNLGPAQLQVNPAEAMESLREAAAIRGTQLQIMYEAGDKNGVGTALMEHASTLVNLASAAYVNKENEEAKMAYETAMGVFELMEDFDKLSKCLMNLANMHELQLSKKDEACAYRKKLVALYKEHMPERAIPDECPVCLEALCVDQETSDDRSLMILSCYHMLHNSCWDKWCAEKGEGAECPHCKQPIPLFT